MYLQEKKKKGVGDWNVGLLLNETMEKTDELTEFLAGDMGQPKSW